MFKTIHLVCVVAVLCASGIWHFLPPHVTARWTSREQGIRILGGLLLELTIPCVAWGGVYYWTLFAMLTASGFSRLCFPKATFKSFRQAHPIWIQGCLLLESATLVWALRH